MSSRGGRPSWALAGVVLAAVAGTAAGARAAPVAIAIVAPERCPPALQERIAEQLADVADAVEWSCLRRLDDDEPFRSDAAPADELRFWIDVRSGSEVRFMLRDSRSDRFVVRRIPTPGGLDEIGREEIGQIVRSALLAVRAGPQESLTRAEARAEIARWSQPAPAPKQLPAPTPAGGSARSPRRPLAIEVGGFGSVRAFAPQVPAAGELGIGIRIGRWGSLDGWLDVGSQWPVRYRGTPLGVDLGVLSARAGLDAVVRLGGRMEGRVGAGAGLTRTTFTPQPASSEAIADPPGVFWAATARALAGVDARLSAHAVLGLTAFVDVTGADVHYDVRQSDGAARRVLTPRRVQPGVALRLAWSR